MRANNQLASKSRPVRLQAMPMVVQAGRAKALPALLFPGPVASPKRCIGLKGIGSMIKVVADLPGF
jgi:hypothetical protein